jgi:Domain of unknown function (DUF4136)
MRRKCDHTASLGATLSTLAVGLLLVLCPFSSAQTVRTNAMPDTDFSQYHTYKWVPIEVNRHPNQIVDAQIKQAVDQQLASKGLTKTEGRADLDVAYQVAVGRERQWNAFGSGGGLRWGGGMGSATSSTIANGTLGLDMYDGSSEKLVWRGEATNTLNASANQEKTEKNIDKAVAKLLKNFPPKTKK